MDSEMTNSKKVMVTGATGYIASWIVKYLLDEGYTVHAAIRNSSDEKKIKHLEKIKSSSKGTLRYFESDLLSPNSYESAMEGCEIVFHTASPFVMDSKDPQGEVIDPALEGTRNVIKTVEKKVGAKLRTR